MKCSDSLGGGNVRIPKGNDLRKFWPPYWRCLDSFGDVWTLDEMKELLEIKVMPNKV